MEKGKAVMEVCRPELEMFDHPRVSDKIVSVYKELHRPVGALSNQGPVIFTIPASPDFTSLSDILLSIKVSVTESDGTPLPPNLEKDQKSISICNDFFDSLMRSIGLEIKGARVGGDHAFHPHISVLKTLLSYPDEVADGNLKHTIFWEPDANGFTYEFVLSNRSKFISGSQEVEMVCRLNHDMFNTTKLLPPNLPLTISIRRSTPEFALIDSTYSVGKYTINWIDAKLEVARVKCSDKVMKSYNARRSGSTVYLPFCRVDARSFDVPTGSRHFRANSIFVGTLPVKCLLVLTDPESLGYGQITNNPVVFPAFKYDVNYVQFFINERPVLVKPYRPDFKEGKTVPEYFMALEQLGLGLGKSTLSNGMSYTHFNQFYGVFAVDLTEFSENDQGALSIELRFGTATEKPISGLVLAQFQSYTKITSTDEISVEDYR